MSDKSCESSFMSEITNLTAAPHPGTDSAPTNGTGHGSFSSDADAAAPTAPLTVLVIDDEKNIRTTLSLCLQGIGCEVTDVPSADVAVAALGRQAFDLAFLDLRLG